MTTALFLGQYIHLTGELSVGMNGTGLSQNLTTLDVGSLNTTQQAADVVAGLSIVQNLTEHLNTGANGLGALVLQTNDLNFLAGLQLASLHTAGSNGTTTGDGEHILYGHQERQVSLTVRSGDILVNSVHQLFDALASRIVVGRCFQSLQCGTLDDGAILIKAILSQGLTNFHLNQLKQLRIVHLVGLVQENDDCGHAYLTSQQQMLLGLRHGAIGSSDNQDSAIHLRSTGDHVLNVVSMAGAVHVCIVALVGLILNVSGVDCDTTLSLFRSLIDICIVLELCIALVCKVLGDSCGQSGLTMVNMADRTNVNMGFGSVKMFFCHWNFLLKNLQ